MNIYEQTIFYNNRDKLKQSQKLLDISRDLLYEVVDEFGSNLEKVGETARKISEIKDALDDLMKLNEELFYNEK